MSIISAGLLYPLLSNCTHMPELAWPRWLQDPLNHYSKFLSCFLLAWGKYCSLMDLCQGNREEDGPKFLIYTSRLLMSPQPFCATYQFLCQKIRSLLVNHWSEVLLNIVFTIDRFTSRNFMGSENIQNIAHKNHKHLQF